MRTMELELAGLLALGDPGEGAQVGEADLHRLALHVQEGLPIELLVPCPDLVSRIAEHPHPVGDEMAFARLGIVKLTGQRSRAAAAQAMPHDEDLADIDLGD